MSDDAPLAPSGSWRRRLAAVRALGPAAPLLLGAMAGPLLGVAVLTTTTRHWLPWFGDDLPGLLVFVALGAVATAGCLLPTHATSFVAGWLFGPWLGPAAAWLVILLAATVGFSVLRRLVGARVLDALERSPRGAALHQALLGRGTWRSAWLIALLRLSPLLPFAATNLLLAALHVRGIVFLLATVVGITPRAVAVALVGAGLQDFDWQAGELRSPGWTAFAVGTTLLVLVVVGRAARTALRRELPSGPAA